MSRITAADIRWMRLAIIQAEQALHPQWRVGAVLVRGGAVLCTGNNRYRNEPSQVDAPFVSYHAEEVVLRRAKGNTAGAVLYVARVTRSGMLGLAKPCASCADKLLDAGIHSVVWTHPYGVEGERLR